MKKMIVIILFLAGAISLPAQKPDQIGVKELESVLSVENDTLYIINFWATWCSPCVKEIGYFEAAHRTGKGKKQKVILINLDFPNQTERRVIPFIKEKDLTATILQMTELDYNKWIPIVDPEWGGQIPATLFMKNGEKHFVAEELTELELNQIIANF